jgi:hypothetical protein
VTWRDTPPFPPCRQPPAPFSSRFKETPEAVSTTRGPPFPGKQFSGSMMSRTNSAVFSSRVARRMHAPHLRSRSTSSFSPIAAQAVHILPLRHTASVPGYHAVPCELRYPHRASRRPSVPVLQLVPHTLRARKSTNAIVKAVVHPRSSGVLFSGYLSRAVHGPLAVDALACLRSTRFQFVAIRNSSLAHVFPQQ